MTEKGPVEAAWVWFDGACEPPRGGGVATYGFVIAGAAPAFEEKDLAVRPWSPRATNNVAEYVGAIRALEHLAGTGWTGPVVVRGDSQLVIRQMTGEYRVTAEHLKAYHDRLAALSKRFSSVEFLWIPRAQNTRADELSKEAIRDCAAEAQRHRPSEPVVPAPGEPDEPLEEADG